MTVGLIGYGVVNKEMHKLFPDAMIYDPYLGLHDTAATAADFIFVAVPTPCKDKGKLDCSIVENVLKNCHRKSIIILRSAVNPGFADKFNLKGFHIVVMPEYLGETVAHPLLDEKDRKFLIIGGARADRRKVIELMQTVYNANITIRQVTAKEAEVIKLSENRAIAYKVAQCQELYDACQKNGVDYYEIRDAVYGDDPRFNLYWTFIFPDARGFNSKCIPKDVYAWSDWAGRPELTEALLAYNDKLITKDKDGKV
jgi:UDP-glucose 6-dehydrogenase